MNDNWQMSVTLKWLIDFMSMVMHKHNVTGAITIMERNYDFCWVKHTTVQVSRLLL
jgi:hypothetical protein